MAYNPDWLPQNHAELHGQGILTTDYLMNNLNRMGIMGGNLDWVETVFIPHWEKFTNAYTAWENITTRTQLIIATFMDARATFVPVYRQLYRGLLKNNPCVTDEDLVAMGLPKRSANKPTPTPRPTTIPTADVKMPSPGVLVVHFSDRGSTSKAKPAGVHGVEIAWALLDEHPQNDWNKLTNYAFDTKTPSQFTFSGRDRGKKFYFALRWANTRGERGNWSEIYEAIVP